MNFDSDKTLVMGILNVTPDSFSDGGNYNTVEKALERAQLMVDEGADIIDIGAESTRPTSSALSSEEEIARLKPFLGEVRRVVSVPISIDTYHAKTAAYALEQGVDIVNDVWGGQADRDILRVAAAYGCEYIYMHNRVEPTSDNVMHVLIRETMAGVEAGLAAGIKENQMWIDPGIGFGKTYEQNLSLLSHLDTYRELGFPVLLGTSRKSVIGNTLNLPVGQRLEGSLATVAVGVFQGVQAVRVHDVEASVRVCRMVEAIRHAR